MRAYFKEDNGDMIVLMNRVMGSPQGPPFEPWMYYFINEIITGVKMIDWAKIISNNLDVQLKNLEENMTFYMSSYLVYSLARTYRYRGLTCRGEVGNKENQFAVYDCYPQLHLEGTLHFKRVNDAFMMHITRMLQGGLHQRLSQESKYLVSRFGYWYIQYPRFTYLRIQGFSGPPYKLPMYPTNRVVLLEAIRQLESQERLFLFMLEMDWRHVHHHKLSLVSKRSFLGTHYFSTRPEGILTLFTR